MSSQITKRRLQNRVAIVTGSGQGIGQAIAAALAAEGASIVTNSRKPGTPGGDAATTAEQIRASGGTALPFFADVSQFRDAERLVQAAINTFGKADILVNNAGIENHVPVAEMSEETWDNMIAVNLKGPFNCTHHVCRHMIDNRWGRIISATSGVRAGLAEEAHYAAAKAGVVGLTKSVAREVGKYGVTCNTYAPGAKTRMIHEDFIMQQYENLLFTKEQYERLMNMPGPEAVAQFVLYLCTVEASDINGQVFDIMGNYLSMDGRSPEKKTLVKAQGFWTVDELVREVPRALLQGYRNPAPFRAPSTK